MLKYFILLITAITLGACATHKSPPQPVEWNLAPNANASYQFLKFNEHPDGEQGINALKKAIANDPSPYLYLQIANAYWRQTNFQSAREILKEGIARYPEEKDLYISLAKSYLGEGLKQSALTTILQFLNKKPGQWNLIEDAASLYLQENECANALDILKKIPGDNRTARTEYLFGRAQTCLEMNKAAISHLNKAVEKDPDMIKAWAELAFVHEKEKNYARAESIYRKIIDMDHAGNELLLRIISLDLKLNSPDKAMLMVEQGPQDPDFRLDAAAEFITHKYFEHAKRILKHLLKTDDPPDGVYLQLAILAYDSNRDLQAGIEYLEKIPESSPLYQNSLRLRGNFELENGNLNETAQIVQKGLNKYPGDNEFWKLKARIEHEKDQLSKALKTLDQALAKWPESKNLLTYKAILLEETGRQDKAMACMEKIISMDPDNAEALNFVGYILADQGRDLDRALVLINNALKQEPTNGYYLDSLAWVLFKRGELKKAWSTINQAIDLNEKDPIIWMHYGDIAMAMEKWNQAVKGYQNALDMDIDDRYKATTRQKLSRSRNKLAN